MVTVSSCQHLILHLKTDSPSARSRVIFWIVQPAALLEELGCRLVGVEDDRGGYSFPDGINARTLKAHGAEHKTVEGFPGLASNWITRSCLKNHARF
jgi:hypothetical protein